MQGFYAVMIRGVRQCNGLVAGNKAIVLREEDDLPRGDDGYLFG